MVEEQKEFGVLNSLRNKINAAFGYQQSFEELIGNGDVMRAIGMMTDHSKAASRCLLEYNSETHKVVKKPKKAIYDKDGNYLREKDVNRIIVPYHKFINEVALVFLYGRPVTWLNNTPSKFKKERAEYMNRLDNEQLDEETQFALKVKVADIAKYDRLVNERFNEFKAFLEELHFNAHIREAKRAAGAERCSAMLFHLYQENKEPKCRIKVLSKANQDDIFTLFDQYGKMLSAAWGYNTLDSKSRSVEHYDIYFPEVIYRCERSSSSGWTIKKEKNPVGKIPIIVFEQEEEWEGVQTLIDRVEHAYSKIADTNDNFADPALVASAEIINALPKQEEDSKLYVLKNGGKMEYLERSGSNEARTSEVDKLDEQIMSKSFTPDLSIDALKGLSNASGATLEMCMTLANIKADKRKDTHDGYLDRVASLVCAIMDNVTHIENKGFGELRIGHSFNKPFGDDIQQTFDNLVKAYGAGGISKQTFVEQNYLVKDSGRELELLKQEDEEASQKQKEAMMLDVFGSAE